MSDEEVDDPIMDCGPIEASAAIEDEPDQTIAHIERVSTIWAFVVHHPAQKTPAGSLVPPSETLIRITTNDDTHTLVSALSDGEMMAFRRMAQYFSRETGLRVTLRRFREETDEEEIEDGRVRSLNRVVLAG